MKNEITIVKRFDEAMYPKLPQFFQKVTCDFQNNEKDLALLSAITFASGVLGINGYYDNQLLDPNLFTIIIAPPAAGKGCIKWSEKLGDEFRKYLKTEFAANMTQYKKKYKKYQDLKGTEKEIIEPEVPQRKILFLPGDSSTSAIIQAIHDNGGGGVLFETEADVLVNTSKQDWGDFSGLLRRAFHNEPYRLLRKTNELYIEIERPRFSVLLSGTHQQCRDYFRSTENGLFSRFIFYLFEHELYWKDVFSRVPDIKINRFKELSEELLMAVLVFKDIQPHFRFSEIQTKDFHKTNKEYQSEVFETHGDFAISQHKRIAVIHFKIAMILSAFRCFETEENCDSEIVCLDQDYEVSKHMVQILMNHALSAYEVLFPKKNIGEQVEEVKQNSNRLPDKLKIEILEDYHNKGITNYSVLAEKHLGNKSLKGTIHKIVQKHKQIDGN